MVASERSATTRAATSASRTIDAVERLARLNEGMTESLLLQHEILLRVHEAFERFEAIYKVVQYLYIHSIALVQQRWASTMPEQADATHASDSKEAHTDIQQAPNVSHTDEVATADDLSVVQCEEGPCDAGGNAASARFDAGEVMQDTAADFHPCKTYIVMMSDNPASIQWGGPSAVGHRATWKVYTRVLQRTNGPAGMARKWQTSMGRMAQQPFGRTSLSSCGMRHRWRE